MQVRLSNHQRPRLERPLRQLPPWVREAEGSAAIGRRSNDRLSRLLQRARRPRDAGIFRGLVFIPHGSPYRAPGIDLRRPRRFRQ